MYPRFPGTGRSGFDQAQREVIDGMQAQGQTRRPFYRGPERRTFVQKCTGERVRWNGRVQTFRLR